ncbi:unnamed protein product [Rhizoctonia solani]|uniref:Potassium channel tetramerisation-type BTB domain-containing protein n=1 Tax=Rhizoctonia solani TaxID=456999 RepID=A0A8H2WF61_9AGAM|nr:uncharacterized protein RhiXN_10149 [Rhizoctonia solani]QRW23825.1 hypothetical protein RhiXN_10149 [Rhizoctonia solani]CAE6375725.1 unnamed protein product [Rhizoctonia solani]
MSFLGDFREGKTLQLDIPRDPHLFRIIQKYLRGYTVLPLSYNQIPLDATRESMMANLREDAVFYQLDGLAYAIDALTLPYVALMKPSEWHLAFLGTYVHTSDQEDPGYENSWSRQLEGCPDRFRAYSQIPVQLFAFARWSIDL